MSFLPLARICNFQTKPQVLVGPCSMSLGSSPHPNALMWAMSQTCGIAAVQACVIGSTLWVFGGTIEIGDKEITLDE